MRYWWVGKGWIWLGTGDERMHTGHGFKFSRCFGGVAFDCLFELFGSCSDRICGHHGRDREIMLQEFESIIDSHSSSICNYLDTAIVVQGGSKIQSLQRYPHVWHQFGVMRIMHSVQMRAMGAEAKGNIPSMDSCTGFFVFRCTMLMVMSVCSRSLHQLDTQ